MLQKSGRLKGEEQCQNHALMGRRKFFFRPVFGSQSRPKDFLRVLLITTCPLGGPVKGGGVGRNCRGASPPSERRGYASVEWRGGVAPPRLSQMAKPMSFNPANGESIVCLPSQVAQMPVARESGPDVGTVSSPLPWHAGQSCSMGVKCSSTSASLPGGLPLSFGMILMVNTGNLSARGLRACRAARLPLQCGQPARPTQTRLTG